MAAATSLRVRFNSRVFALVSNDVVMQAGECTELLPVVDPSPKDGATLGRFRSSPANANPRAGPAAGEVGVLRGIIQGCIEGTARAHLRVFFSVGAADAATGACRNECSVEIGDRLDRKVLSGIDVARKLAEDEETSASVVTEDGRKITAFCAVGNSANAVLDVSFRVTNPPGSGGVPAGGGHRDSGPHYRHPSHQQSTDMFQYYFNSVAAKLRSLSSVRKVRAVTLLNIPEGSPLDALVSPYDVSCILLVLDKQVPTWFLDRTKVLREHPRVVFEYLEESDDGYRSEEFAEKAPEVDLDFLDTHSSADVRERSNFWSHKLRSLMSQEKDGGLQMLMDLDWGGELPPFGGIIEPEPCEDLVAYFMLVQEEVLSCCGSLIEISIGVPSDVSVDQFRPSELQQLATINVTLSKSIPSWPLDRAVILFHFPFVLVHIVEDVDRAVLPMTMTPGYPPYPNTVGRTRPAGPQPYAETAPAKSPSRGSPCRTPYSSGSFSVPDYFVRRSAYNHSRTSTTLPATASEQGDDVESIGALSSSGFSEVTDGLHLRSLRIGSLIAGKDAHDNIVLCTATALGFTNPFEARISHVLTVGHVDAAPGSPAFLRVHEPAATTGVGPSTSTYVPIGRFGRPVVDETRDFRLVYLHVDSPLVRHYLPRACSPNSRPDVACSIRRELPACDLASLVSHFLDLYKRARSPSAVGGYTEGRVCQVSHVVVRGVDGNCAVWRGMLKVNSRCQSVDAGSPLLVNDPGAGTDYNYIIGMFKGMTAHEPRMSYYIPIFQKIVDFKVDRVPDLLQEQ